MKQGTLNFVFNFGAIIFTLLFYIKLLPIIILKKFYASNIGFNIVITTKTNGNM